MTAEKRAEPTLLQGVDRLIAERDRLKAANVELVSALEAAEPWLMRLTSEAIDGEGVRSEYAAICAQVRAALAKHREPTP